MKSRTGFDPKRPFDELPLVPPDKENYETVELLKQEALSRAAVSELKGIANIIPNQDILVNAIVLREAKDSSEIENIVTTQDAIYKAIAISTQKTIDPAAKEVVRYREALWHGVHTINKKGVLSISDIVKIQSVIVGNDAGVRNTPGTALVSDSNNETVYTPPQSEQRIKVLMRNFADYLNDDDDSLIKSAILHYQFEAIHPFYDGNGRTGRIVNVLYLVLKRHLDIPILYLSSYIIEKKSDYYRLLLEVSSAHHWNNWILYLLKGIEVTAKETIEKLRSIKRLMDETIEFVRQKAPKIYTKELVETLFVHPYCKNVFIERATGVERKAASRYLHKLAEIGLLNANRIGRENIFINKKLMELLRKRK
jgi:Fic family protein